MSEKLDEAVIRHGFEEMGRTEVRKRLESGSFNAREAGYAKQWLSQKECSGGGAVSGAEGVCESISVHADSIAAEAKVNAYKARVLAIIAIIIASLSLLLDVLK